MINVLKVSGLHEGDTIGVFRNEYCMSDGHFEKNQTVFIGSVISDVMYFGLNGIITVRVRNKAMHPYECTLLAQGKREIKINRR